MRADLYAITANQALLKRLKPEQGAASPKGAPDFGKSVAHALKQVDERIKRADELSAKFAAGEDVNVHDVMLAVQEANVALAELVQVRNKAVEAYQEIMRMQL